MPPSEAVSVGSLRHWLGFLLFFFFVPRTAEGKVWSKAGSAIWKLNRALQCSNLVRELRNKKEKPSLRVTDRGTSWCCGHISRCQLPRGLTDTPEAVGAASQEGHSGRNKSHKYLSWERTGLRNDSYLVLNDEQVICSDKYFGSESGNAQMMIFAVTTLLLQ